MPIRINASGQSNIIHVTQINRKLLPQNFQQCSKQKTCTMTHKAELRIDIRSFVQQAAQVIHSSLQQIALHRGKHQLVKRVDIPKKQTKV